jgi:hypothetical protein
MNGARLANVCVCGSVPVRFIHLDKQHTELNFLCKDATTSAAFRIAYFIWLLRGGNDLATLECYSKHMIPASDDLTHLRGAYGPRLLNWIGVDQFQEAMNKNRDIDQIEDFTKPQGRNQIHAVYNDMRGGVLDVSTMVVRDPAIDFDDTNDVPDLIAATFTVTLDSVNCTLFYEKICIGSNYINELWFFKHLTELYRSWLLKRDSSITVISPVANNEIEITIQGSVHNHNLVHEAGGETFRQPFHPNPNIFWKDFQLLSDFERHLRQRIREEVFYNPDVVVKQLYEDLERCLIANMQHVYLRDMAYVLLVFMLNKFDKENRSEIVKYASKIQSDLRYEVSHELNLV